MQAHGCCGALVRPAGSGPSVGITSPAHRIHTPVLEQSLSTEEMTFLERSSSLSLRYVRKLLGWRADRGVLQEGCFTMMTG